MPPHAALFMALYIYLSAWPSRTGIQLLVGACVLSGALFPSTLPVCLIHVVNVLCVNILMCNHIYCSPACTKYIYVYWS